MLFIQQIYFCRYTGHKTEDYSIESAILTSDNHILSGSVSGDMYCWDLVSSEIVRKFVHSPGKTLNSICVHPRKDVIMTASVGTVKVWSSLNDVPKAPASEDS